MGLGLIFCQNICEGLVRFSVEAGGIDQTFCRSGCSGMVPFLRVYNIYSSCLWLPVFVTDFLK